jgi:hypothetical protein
MKLVAVGDAHEVVVSPAGKGSEMPMVYHWDVISVRITIETTGGELISA